MLHRLFSNHVSISSVTEFVPESDTRARGRPTYLNVFLGTENACTSTKSFVLIVSYIHMYALREFLWCCHHALFFSSHSSSSRYFDALCIVAPCCWYQHWSKAIINIVELSVALERPIRLPDDLMLDDWWMMPMSTRKRTDLSPTTHFAYQNVGARRKGLNWAARGRIYWQGDITANFFLAYILLDHVPSLQGRVPISPRRSSSCGRATHFGCDLFGCIS